jgi:predicted deacetylase
VPPSAAEPGRIAVALHDIEPATFERCALIRDWLDDHGVDRVTLLVIPARDLHPLGERSPEMTSWLAERRIAGDSIAQHGFQHERARRSGLSAQALLSSPARRAGEFVGLDIAETQRAVNAGWRVLKLAGVEPDGFVAPAYAYTPALRSVLPRRFRWWAGLFGIHCRVAGTEESSRLISPALGASGSGRLRRVLSPALIRAAGLAGGRTMRVDLHPSDLQHPQQMIALEWVLGRAGRRRVAITYDQLSIERPGSRPALARTGVGRHPRVGSSGRTGKPAVGSSRTSSSATEVQPPANR